jgi:four helix bundle protein
MTSPQFTLAPRTTKLACDVGLFISAIPKTMVNMDDLKQLGRSSGSVAANYLEADEAISSKDFLHRLKLCKKEARESMLWLELLVVQDTQKDESRRLIQEFHELVKIFHTIIQKVSAKNA